MCCVLTVNAQYNQLSTCDNCGQTTKYSAAEVTNQLRKFQSLITNAPVDKRTQMSQVLLEKCSQVFAPYNETFMSIRGECANFLLQTGDTAKAIELYGQVAEYYIQVLLWKTIV